MTAPFSFEPTANAHILESTFLRGLTPEQVQDILAAGTPRSFAAGSVIISQGHPAQSMFQVGSGMARSFILTTEGKKLPLLALCAGDLAGLGTIQSEPMNYLVSVEAVRDSQCLEWNKPTVRRLVELYPRLYENALFCATQYIQFFISEHMNLATEGARHRAVGILLMFAQNVGRKVSDGIEIEVTNEQLAERANVTLLTVRRLMAQLEKEHIIKKRDGRIVLMSPERLIASA